LFRSVQLCSPLPAFFGKISWERGLAAIRLRQDYDATSRGRSRRFEHVTAGYASLRLLTLVKNIFYFCKCERRASPNCPELRHVAAFLEIFFSRGQRPGRSAVARTVWLDDKGRSTSSPQADWPIAPLNSLRACLKTTSGPAAGDFGCGQDGEFRASPQGL
jgi:hypothetical protein